MDQEQIAAPPAADNQWVQLGVRIGQGQALGFIANQCLAAQAECLRRLREDASYKDLGITWEEFCSRHIGISRSQADHIIRQLDEFGAAYFRLSEIVRVSSETYRKIAPAIQDNVIQIGSAQVPITADNAPEIRRFVQRLRDDIDRKERALRRSPIGISMLQNRLDACFDEMRHIGTRSLDELDLASLRGLIQYSLNKLHALERLIARTP